jgi:hypothetical protein
MPEIIHSSMQMSLIIAFLGPLIGGGMAYAFCKYRDRKGVFFIKCGDNWHTVLAHSRGEAASNAVKSDMFIDPIDDVLNLDEYKFQFPGSYHASFFNRCDNSSKRVETAPSMSAIKRSSQLTSKDKGTASRAVYGI